MQIRSLAWHGAAIVLLIGGYLLLLRNTFYPGPYDYDEADYMYAATLGVTAQATDTPTLTLPEFVRIGVSRRSGEASDLSQLIRASNDVVFYRHLHGPLFTYWLIALRRSGLNEMAIRHASTAFPVSAGLLVYFGGLWLFPGWRGRLASFLAAALVLWSYAMVRTTELAPHALFAALCLAGLVLLAKTIATGRRQYWYWAVMAAGAAFCTLEVALILIFTMVFVAWAERRALRPDWRFAAKSALLFLGTVAVIWPAAIYKLSFVKAYAFMAYLALARQSAWGSVTTGEVWRLRLLGYPVEWILIGAGLLFFALRRGVPGVRQLYPFAFFAGLMVLAVGRVNATMPRYLLPFEPELLTLAAFVLAAMLPPRPQTGLAVAALFSAAIFANTAARSWPNPVVPQAREWDSLAFIRSHGLDRQALLVPHGDLPTLHYYFPHARLRSYLGNRPAPRDLESGQYAAILYPDRPLRFEICKTGG